MGYAKSPQITSVHVLQWCFKNFGLAVVWPVDFTELHVNNTLLLCVVPALVSTMFWLVLVILLAGVAGILWYQNIRLKQHFTASQTDASENSASEERFGQMLDNIDLVAVQSYTPDGKILYWNKASEKMYGYSAKEAIGQSILDLVMPPEIRGIAAHALKNMDESGQSIKGTEIPVMRKDGSRFLVYSNHCIVRRPGQPPELFSIDVDLSDRERAEEALQKAKEAAEAANLLKTEFLANMNHEIRTPMTAIVGYADLLLKNESQQTSPEQRRQWIETIRRNSNHLLQLINDILDLSKIEADRLNIETIPTDPLQILEEVIAQYQPIANEKHLLFKTIFATPIPKTIHSDPTRLRQILLNLVGNAVKFTEKGSVTITLSLRQNTQGKNQLQFEVSDTGIGITPEKLEQLFKPFQQADASFTRRYGGTGMGLHTSKRLAEMLGGHICATSEPSIGTVLTVTLPTGPIKQQHMIDPETAKKRLKGKQDSADEAETEIADSLEGMRILFAEDCPDSRRLISFYLTRAGAKVTACEDGKKLLAKLTVDGQLDSDLIVNPLFDVIITDMQMPELDGYELTRTLRQRGCVLPILALTAHAMAGDAQKCLDCGCDAYQSKPISQEQLIQSVRKLAHHTSTSSSYR